MVSEHVLPERGFLNLEFEKPLKLHPKLHMHA